jgi:HAD superfamily hydrolase (TIGR01549 family)
VLRWIFFDIGNVLINDDPTMAFLYRELHRAMCKAGYRASFRQLLTEREELIRIRGPEHWRMLGRKYLGEEGHWRLMHRCGAEIRSDYMAYHAVIPGAEEILGRLARRFRLGVIANQLREVVDALEELGFGKFLDIYAISELVGLRKPDPALYRWALDRADCRPEEAVMIGDRVDNDIAPARAAGMRTILYQLPHESKGYTPQGDLERLYFESQLRESICRIQPRRAEEHPDAQASDAPGLLAAIENIAGSPSPSEGSERGR